VRIPEELKMAAKAEANMLGISYSEYVRQAIYVRMAWSAAARSIIAGMPPEEALDANHVRAVLDMLTTYHLAHRD